LKPSALEHLLCPSSGQPLFIEVYEAEGDEVIFGSLTAGQHVYPIILGVPRLLPESIQFGLLDDYPEFYKRYPELNPGKGNVDNQAKIRRGTQEAFGYEWTWADDYDADNYHDWFPTGIKAPDVFEGKTGLEVGCGAGRHAEITSTKAKVHFAVDFSIAVDSAYTRLRDKENVHVVQADAFALPFAKRSLDYVYCLGVLQHLHNPPEGFEQLSQFPRQGGDLFVNVYQAGRLSVALLAMFRKIVLKLSNENIRRVSIVCGTVDYYGFIAPWKLVRNTAFGNLVERAIPERIKEYARNDYDVCVVDWFDRLSCPVKIHYRSEDMVGWFTKMGYEDVTVTPYWKAFWNGYGKFAG